MDMVTTKITPLGFYLILISPFVGSFLGVLADRLPRGESVIVARSRCRSCGHPLRVGDLIPVYGYLRHAGRCRHCGTEIPAHVLYIEIAAIGLAATGAIVWQGPLALGLGVAALWILLTLLVTDLVWLRLPDALTAALLIAGLGLGALDPAIGWIDASLTAIGASLAFWLIRIAYHRLRRREGLGLGDVKLMAGIGAMSGLQNTPVVVLVAALAILAVGTVRGLKGVTVATTPFPFGAALCASTLCVTLFHWASI